MDPATAFANLNGLAIILATFVGFFVLGGLWYGPLFGKQWMQAFGFNEQDLEQRNMAKVFTAAFVLTLVAATNLALFIGSEATVVMGLMAGLLAGLGWVATFLGVLYLFEARSFKAYAINAGYGVTSLTLMGAILGGM